jgi:hypothetical protein
MRIVVGAWHQMKTNFKCTVFLFLDLDEFMD